MMMMMMSASELPACARLVSSLLQQREAEKVSSLFHPHVLTFLMKPQLDGERSSVRGFESEGQVWT